MTNAFNTNLKLGARGADENLMRMMHDIIRKLELQAFQFRVVSHQWSIAFGAPKDV
jgi:hypothetical protein